MSVALVLANEEKKLSLSFNVFLYQRCSFKCLYPNIWKGGQRWEKIIFQDEEQNNDFLREISFQTGKIYFLREKNSWEKSIFLVEEINYFSREKKDLLGKKK